MLKFKKFLENEMKSNEFPPDYYDEYPLLDSEEFYFLQVIQRDPRGIRKFKNPNEKMQQISAKADPHFTLEYLLDKNITPSEKVQRIAIEKDPESLLVLIRKGIEVSEKLKEIAVRKSPGTIRFIRNPSEELQLWAISKYPRVIYHMDKVSEEAERQAYILDPTLIDRIKSFKVLKFAIDQDPKNVKYIKNPSIEIQQYALDKDRSLIHDREIKWHPDLLKKYAGTISARDMGII